MCIWSFKLVKFPLSGIFWITTGSLLNKRWRLYNCTFMNSSEIYAAGLDRRPSGLNAHLCFSSPEFTSLYGHEFLFLWIATQSSKTEKKKHSPAATVYLLSMPSDQKQNIERRARGPWVQNDVSVQRSGHIHNLSQPSILFPSVFDGDPPHQIDENGVLSV